MSEIIAVEQEDYRGVLHYPEGPLYHHNYTPNSSQPDHHRSTSGIYTYCNPTTPAPCIPTFANFTSRSVLLTARSYHPGGVNVGMMDGSSQFVADTVDLQLWQSACTPSAVAGEVLFTGFD